MERIKINHTSLQEKNGKQNGFKVNRSHATIAYFILQHFLKS